MRLRLYVVPASHPCAAVEAALRHKGLGYERVDLLPVVHALHQRAVFGRRTVPGLRIDGEKVVGSRAIMRRLEALRAQPPLLPGDERRRLRVEIAETWGEETLQPMGRRLVWAAFGSRPDALASYAEGAQLPVPLRVALAGAPVAIRAARAMNRATDQAAAADLAALPRHLDRVERWIEEGVLGGAEPNVADLQIASTLRILLTLEDVATLLEGRPAGELARRWLPDYPGRMPAGSLASASSAASA